MRVTVQTLASGSSANMALVRTEGAALAVDLGIASQRGTREALAAAGLAPEDLDAVLVSHAHSDHLNPAGLRVAIDAEVPLLAGQWTLKAARQLFRTRFGREVDAGLLHETRAGTTCLVGPFEVTPFAVLHDVPTYGYEIVLRGPASSRRVVVATDLGCAPDELIPRFADADGIVIEANYNDELLRYSPRRAEDKARVASDLGHLSNVQAGGFLQRVAAASRRLPAWVVLAHLSEDHNEPALAVAEVSESSCLGRGMPPTTAAPRKTPGPVMEI